MRPIDADALIEKCGGWYVDECTESGFIGTLENLLATEPTIQPQSTTGQLNDGAQSTARSTDLIDRQAAIDAAKDWYEGLICGSVNGLIKRLNALPTAPPEPQEGHWIGKYPTTHICSECGWLIPDSKVKVFAYCPNCGAKMTISK